MLLPETLGQVAYTGLCTLIFPICIKKIKEPASGTPVGSWRFVGEITVGHTQGSTDALDMSVIGHPHSETRRQQTFSFPTWIKERQRISPHSSLSWWYLSCYQIPLPSFTCMHFIVSRILKCVIDSSQNLKIIF